MKTLKFNPTRKVAKRMTRLYTLAILPPEPIISEVMAIKKYIASKYGFRAALNIPAQITLQQPLQLPEWTESSLIRKLDAFSSKQSSFDITLNGFDHFDDHSLFIKIENEKGIKGLYKNLINYLQTDLSFSKSIVNSNFKPQLTIAYKDVNPDVFSELWGDFEDSDYKRSFTARKIVLLKHNYRQWEVLNELPFSTDLFG